MLHGREAGGWGQGLAGWSLWLMDFPPLSAGVMWLEIVLASVLGFVIYWFVSRDKEETLPLEDGWWGPGARPPGREDESIRPFKVETSDQEIDVRPLLPGRAERRGRGKPALRLGVGLGLGPRRQPASPWGCAAVCSAPTGRSPSHALCPPGPFSLPPLSPPFPTQGPAVTSFVPHLKPGG